MVGNISAGKLCKKNKRTLEYNKSVNNKGGERWQRSFCPSDVCKRLKMNSYFSCLYSPAPQTLREVIPFDVIFKLSHLEKV